MLPVKNIKNFFAAIYGTTEENFPLTKEVGIKWILKDIHWSKIEVEKGKYDFSSYDWIVDNSNKYDLTPLPKLNSIPEWGTTAAEGVHRRTHFAPEGELINDYIHYVQKVLDHYPDIKFFEIWNEPNLDVFLRTGSSQQKYRHYVDKILIPAAEVIHRNNRQVVGPSFSVEWPYSNDIQGHSYNVEDNIKSLEKWLNYKKAWKHIDILSIHYVKGDTEKIEMDNAQNMIPFLDYIYNNWIKPGKLKGIWITEEGLSAIEVNPHLGFYSLEPWERSPYSQWAPRYIIPYLDWSIRHEWDFQDKYKLFWFNFKDKNCTLTPNMLLKETKSGVELSETGMAYRTMVSNLTNTRQVDVYDRVKVGFGLDAIEDYPYHFKNYSFKLDQSIFTAAWLDLPGIADITPEGNLIEAQIEGLEKGPINVKIINYISGEEQEVNSYTWDNDTLKIKLPRIGDPILYFKVER